MMRSFLVDSRFLKALCFLIPAFTGGGAYAQVDVKYATVECTLPTTAINFECLIGSLGWTPSAVVATVTADTSNGGVDTSVQFGFGVAVKDGSGGSASGKEWAIAAGDIQSGADARDSIAMTDQTIVVPSADLGLNGTIFEATGVGSGSGTCTSGGNPGPVSNGWCFTAGKASGEAHIVKLEFYGGTDIEVNAGVVTLNAGEDTATDHSMTSTSGDGQFQPDLLITGATSQPFDDATDFHLNISMGAVDLVGTIVQKSVIAAAEDGASTSNNFQRNSDVYGGGAIDPSTGGVDWMADFSSPDSTGFTITERLSAASGDGIGYLAIACGTCDVWVGSITSPTSAGSDWTESGVGFTPIMARYIQSGVTSTTGEGSTASDTQAFSIGNSMYDGTREHTAMSQSEDGQAASDTEDNVNSKFLWTRSGSGPSLTHNGDFSMGDGLNSSGWTMANEGITTADATALIWVGYALGVGAGGGGVSAAAVRRQRGED